jgi:PKD repeat protein
VTLTGTATDAQDGTLSGSSVTWELVRHHVHNDASQGAEHTHPFQSGTGTSLTFTAPHPEDLESTNGSWIEAIFTAQDSRGLKTVVRRELRPRLVELQLTSSPTGRTVRVNGIPFTTPATVKSWEGWELSAEAPQQQDGDTTWLFDAWSDGGAASHTLLTPATATTYQATFKRLNRAPVASATATPASGPAPLVVSFDASGSTDADGDPLSFAWDLDGDGTFDDSTVAEPRQTFTGVGDHTVKVRVSDTRGGSDVKSLVVTVQPPSNRMPAARVSATPRSGPVPLKVTFDGSGSTDPDGDTLSYAWDLDDDGAFDDSTAPAPEQTFTALGDHTVELLVSDGRGGSHAASVVVTAEGAAPTAGTAAVSGSPREGATLTVEPSGFSLGTPAGSYAFTWQRCTAEGASCDVVGTGATYRLSGADVGRRLRATITAGNECAAGCGSAAATSPLSPAVLPLPPVNGTAPALQGEARVRSTLSVQPGTWASSAPVRFQYAWQRCGAGGSRCTDIPGAGGASYTLTKQDAGSTLRVVVTAANDGGSAALATAPSAVVRRPATRWGTARDDRLTGTADDDVIDGRGGADLLRALGGDDTVNGGSGADRVFGDPADDRLNGGPGDDRLDGGTGTDRIFGGPGNDRIQARDGRADVIDCGGGRDSVVADRKDRIRGGCEKVTRR